MRITDPAAHESLRALAAAYAAGVDRRDAEAVRRCFTEGAELIIQGRDGVRALPERALRGRDAIGGITTAIARYERTFHLVGQGRYDVTGTRATGEVYCEAHHHSRDDAGSVTDRVLFIRYQDEYVADDDGEWLIARRVVGVDWSVDAVLGALGDAGAEAGAGAGAQGEDGGVHT